MSTPSPDNLARAIDLLTPGYWSAEAIAEALDAAEQRGRDAERATVVNRRAPPDHTARPWTREHQHELWHFEIGGSVMRCGLVISGSPIVASELDASTRPKCARCLGGV